MAQLSFIICVRAGWSGGRDGTRRIMGLKPRRNKNGIKDGSSTKFVNKTTSCRCFEEFDISSLTKRGLKAHGFSEPTEIQAESIPIALRGLDLLGAAKTGSGKTLAFLIPVLESLNRKGWCKLDGLGALIISPTRELALQTYDVLRKAGKFHDFSAALIMGGTSWEFERDRISQTNIVIGTPGRLLQHMDENPAFNPDNLQILVLDEADRILDLGFQDQINAIVEHLPSQRQTLLFSATQTRSVRDLARLSLRNPVFVSVHEHSANVTPDRLTQSVTVCEEEDKVNLLWSFLKRHKHKKIIVFLTSCKQVRFYWEAFKRLKPGILLFGLYGTMNPMKRVEVYQEFSAKETGALLATDVAARGLDFPAVDWVVQLDCPPDAEEYIHRSGRTARLRREGEALLVLTPSQEKPMLDQLLSANVPPLAKILVDQNKIQSVTRKLEAHCAKDASLKCFAQKCFVSYLRSVYMMRNKAVFNVEDIRVKDLAASLGLPFAPRVRFLRKKGVKFLDDEGPSKDIEQSQIQLPSSSSGAPDMDSDQDFLRVSRKDVFGIFGGVSEEKGRACFSCKTAKDFPEKRGKGSTKAVSKESAGRKLLKKKKKMNRKVIFEDGEDEAKVGMESASTVEVETKAESQEAVSGLNIDTARARMKEVDKEDRKIYKDRIKARKKEKRLKKKQAEAERKNRPVLPKWNVTLDVPCEESEEEEEPKLKKGKQDYSTDLKQEEELALKLLTSSPLL